MSNFPQIPKPIFSAAVAGTKTTIKATPCSLHGCIVLNGTAAIAYVQVFDAKAADVNVGTTVPDYVFPVPPNTAPPLVLPVGKDAFRHDIGLVIACTTSPTNNTGAACDVLMFVR